MGAVDVASQQDNPFGARVNQRLGALPPRLIGFATLGGAVLGMILYAAFGPNDIWTALLAGAVMGGVAARLLIRGALMAREAWETQRMHLAVVVAGIAAILCILYWPR